jgi:hypothetical protein
MTKPTLKDKGKVEKIDIGKFRTSAFVGNREIFGYDLVVVAELFANKLNELIAYLNQEREGK